MKITIYTKDGCVWCKKMIDYIMGSGLVEEFQVQEVTKENSVEISTYLRNATERQEVGFPVTFIANEKHRTIIIGYDPNSFEEAVKKYIDEK